MFAKSNLHNNLDLLPDLSNKKLYFVCTSFVKSPIFGGIKCDNLSYICSLFVKSPGLEPPVSFAWVSTLVWDNLSQPRHHQHLKLWDNSTRLKNLKWFPIWKCPCLLEYLATAPIKPPTSSFLNISLASIKLREITYIMVLSDLENFLSAWHRSGWEGPLKSPSPSPSPHPPANRAKEEGSRRRSRADESCWNQH